MCLEPGRLPPPPPWDSHIHLPPSSCSQVSQLVDLKVERVRSLEQMAMRRLRKPAFTKRLEDFLHLHV